MPQIVKDDPWWLDPRTRTRPLRTEAVLGPTTSGYEGFNPPGAR